MYTDNALQFVALGLGMIVALSYKLAGYNNIVKLHIPILNVSIFLPMFLSTLVFGAFMFFRSAYWCRMDRVAITKHLMFQHKEGEEVMNELFKFHEMTVKNEKHEQGHIVFRLKVLQ
jgi:hypothetical protein